MMEATQTADGQLLITGAGGDQPLIMSAEDAAQFLAQAGLQLADIGDSERIIIGQAGQDQHEVITPVHVVKVVNVNRHCNNNYTFRCFDSLIKTMRLQHNGV
jgi:hypothetical protein